MSHPILSRWLVVVASAFLSMATALADVNINTASESELESLPGIGPSKAAAIVKFRQDHGPFATVEQLDAVPGIGDATMASLRPLVTVGDGDASLGDLPLDEEPSGRASATSASADDRAPRIDINSASPTELEELPGIGATKAAAIFAYREKNGRFASCDALDAVEGIGPATVNTLRGRCTAE